MEEVHHHKRQSQQFSQHNDKQKLSLLIQESIRKQGHEPIQIYGRNYYVVEKGSFENCFPRNVKLEHDEHDEHINQLIGQQPIYCDGNYYYVISEANYNKCGDSFIRQNKDDQGPTMNYHSNNANYHLRIKELEDRCKTLQSHNQKLESDRQQLLQQLNNAGPMNYHGNNANYHLRIKELEDSCKTFQSQNQQLKNHNDNLKKEASKYQSALGDATSFHLGNQDSDATSQLLKDIGNLHRKLEKFCGLKKKGIEINDQKAIEKLLKQYDCSIKGTIKESKNLISGALERYVIETIIEKADEYFKENDKEVDEQGDKNQQQSLEVEIVKTTGNDKVDEQGDKGQQQSLEAKIVKTAGNDKDNEEVDKQGDERQQQSLEAKIVKTTDQLLKMINSFSTIRTGNDEVTKAAPTKLRQQIYGILGNRGFSSTVLDKSDSKEHPFVEKLQKEILDLMNRYREIKDQEKLAENEKMINEIIRQVINIFFFRLKVQEPTAEWKWFPKNTEINTLTMDGPWDKDELEYLSVDICAFPLIGSNLSSADEKMMFQAQIVADSLL